MFGRWSSRSSRRGPARSGAAGDVEPTAHRVAAGSHQPGDVAGSVENLERALEVLMNFAGDRNIAASAALNPLLGIWDAARAVGPEVSDPVERMLTVAIHRSTLGSDELIACVQEVRALALQEAVLSNLVMG